MRIRIIVGESMSEDRYSEYMDNIADLENKKEEIQRNIRKLEEENENLYDFHKRSNEIIDDLKIDWGSSRDLSQIEETMMFLAAKAKETNEEKRETWSNQVRKLELRIEECKHEFERAAEEENE